MRGVGVGYLAATVGWVVLPGPVKWWPFAMVTLIGLFGLLTAIADKRAQIEQAQAADLATTLDYLDRIRKADVDHEWDELLAAVDADRPLGTTTPLPHRLRTVSPTAPRRSSAIPTQRTEGLFS